MRIYSFMQFRWLIIQKEMQFITDGLEKLQEQRDALQLEIEQEDVRSIRPL
jgi:hypothetical protein